MSDDHILLQQIIEEHSITVNSLANRTGFAASTVYRFLAGGATIPMIVWRTLYEKTGDVRILKLITGTTNCVVVPLPDNPLKLDKPTISHLHNERRQQVKCEGLVLDILSDDVIDRKDRAAIEKYNRTFPEMIQSLYQTHQSINDEYKQSRKRSKT